MKTIIYFRYSIILFFVIFQFSSLFAQGNCNDDEDPPENTFEVFLPAINSGITEVGFAVPPIWNGKTPVNETIHIPNGRPIYALIVSGYASNTYLDELMLYNFARYLMDKGAYVHYAWWNNLLAPYMERPLHHNQSNPGNLGINLAQLATINSASNKALPGEDYQFVADAKILLREIRAHNPNAIIIVAGHSMGGGAVVHLGSETSELIDILAPIDPVGNRNIPFAGVGRSETRDFNWTRWRVSRDGFRGYKKSENSGTVLNSNCTPTGNWLKRPPIVRSSNPLCLPIMFIDNAPTLTFGNNIINLHHRYQQEALFPFDFYSAYHFGHTPPAGGYSTQSAVAMQDAFTGLSRNKDPGGWPRLGLLSKACCPTGEGVGWNLDGHGEIVGYRGPGKTVPLGVRLRTSPQCGRNCSGLSWPARSYSLLGGWENGDENLRKQKLKDLENLPINQSWPDRPYNPNLCRVSSGLIHLFEIMNKPPNANAGEDQVVECTGQDGALVTLDGSQSSDPDGDQLTYTWTGDFGTQSGAMVDVKLPMGVHCIELKIEDLVGHIDLDWMTVEVVDTTGPELTVSLNPNCLWPPNHKWVDITATVEATDLCGNVESIILYSIDVSEADDVIGSGNTSPDTFGAEFSTHDLLFKLRAERSGKNRSRTYTVTYKATDDSGNFTLTSYDVIVENPRKKKNKNQQNKREKLESDLLSHAKSYPNPFNVSTNIEYFLNEKKQIKITVYDIMGREVDVLFEGIQESGSNSVVFDGVESPPGVYFYRITFMNGVNAIVGAMVKN